MVEFLDSTKVSLETSKIRFNVLTANPLSPTLPRCDVTLDKRRLEDILENIPSAVVVFEPS
jgi:hypothetical protein